LATATPLGGHELTSALVVSRSFPRGDQAVHGIYQRLGTQVVALSRMVDRVNCLFLVSTEENCAPDVVRAHEQRLRQLWSPAVSIRLAPTVTGAVPESWWKFVWQGVFDFQQQPIARHSSTAASIHTVSAALDEHPNVILAHRLTSMAVFLRIAHQAPKKIDKLPLFLDMDDIEHSKLVRQLMRDPSWSAQRLLLLQVPALILAEIQAIRLASATFVCYG